MSDLFPKIEPLKRLNVIDGLEMTSERWKIAHQYHRQRQNLYYQSLYQPGIICGLGVCIIPPPTDVSPQYHKHRWVQIQPGIAINSFGNIIVVPQPLDFYISFKLKDKNSLLIYLVISYVDPEELKLSNTVEVLETFQIDESNQPPQEGDIELCRIQLQGEEITLQSPQNVFEPTPNSLDLRYRQKAKAKPLFLVSIAILQGDATTKEIDGLNRLLRSIKPLLHSLEGNKEVIEISPNFSQQQNQTYDYDVLYLSQQQCEQLSPTDFSFIESYLRKGGIILVRISTQNTKLEELQFLENQLSIEIEKIRNFRPSTIDEKNNKKKINYFEQMYPLLTDELTKIKSTVREEISSISSSVKQFAQKLDISLESWEQLSSNHPLKNEPFLFQSLPTINKQKLQILGGESIIVIIGDIFSVFTSDNNPSLSREVIRTNQELMINILHFGHRKKQMQQNLQSF
ncbi:MAG TPA: hypothetical protein DCF68_17235 [Cyanothece sp. UBA12306]|nr:hypothetical protein [Cyanothece sp. UBA12306]